MKNSIILTAAICAFAVDVQCLTCQAGAEVSSKSFFNYEFYNTTVCQDDGSPQFCIRGEGLFLVFGVVEANVTTGLCVNASTCEDNCDDLAFRLIRQAAATNIDIGLDLSTVDISINTCEKICCNTDNCNTQTIATIRNNQQNPNPSTTTSTTVQMPDTLSCVTGYQLPTLQNSLDKISCPVEVNHACLRQEITLKPQSGEELNFAVGVCSNSSSCVDSCIDAANTFIAEGLELGIDFGLNTATEKFEISSCERICCQNDNCNEEIISEILQGDGAIQGSHIRVQGGNSADGITTNKAFVLAFSLMSLFFSTFQNTF